MALQSYSFASDLHRRPTIDASDQNAIKKEPKRKESNKKPIPLLQKHQQGIRSPLIHTYPPTTSPRYPTPHTITHPQHLWNSQKPSQSYRLSPRPSLDESVSELPRFSNGSKDARQAVQKASRLSVSRSLLVAAETRNGRFLRPVQGLEPRARTVSGSTKFVACLCCLGRPVRE